MSQKACYVWKSKDNRNGRDEHTEAEQASKTLSQRTRLFDSLWIPLQARINDKINASNDEVLSDIRNFLSTAETLQDGAKIPAGLLITSASPSVQLFEQLRAQTLQRQRCLYISITAAESPNLRTLLRYVVTKCTYQVDPNDVEDEPMSSGHIGPKRLAYDFDILHDFCKTHQIKQIVITLHNSDSFDTSVLADFIKYLQIWIDRVPAVLLFDIATSTSTLEDRLPIAALRCLRGQSFDAAKTDEVLETIFEIATTDTSLHFGPSLTSFVFQRAKDYTQNIESFVQSLKYAYMCHVYGNAGSRFLDESQSVPTDDNELYETIRHLPSFRVHAETLLSRKEGANVRQLLGSNDYLKQAIRKGIQDAGYSMTWLVGAVQIFRVVKSRLSKKTAPSFSRIYTQVLSGELLTSPLYRETLMGVRMATQESLLLLLPMIYDKLMSMPASGIEISPDDFEDIRTELKQLASSHVSSQPQASKKANSKRLANTETKQRNSKPVVDFNNILMRFHDLLDSYFKACFIPMKSIFLHEIIFCDSTPLLQGALAPKPRVAVERALSRPHDYLGCSCCDQSEGKTSTNPSTAILYQLFVESGVLINVFDLWVAFEGIMLQQHDDEQFVMSLFFRSLAELKYMGMLKPSRKRVDHIGKVLWQGL